MGCSSKYACRCQHFRGIYYLHLQGTRKSTYLLNYTALHSRTLILILIGDYCLLKRNSKQFVRLTPPFRRNELPPPSEQKRSTGTCLPDYMAAHPRRPQLHIHCQENLKSCILQAHNPLSGTLQARCVLEFRTFRILER